ncbi:unnamed protein product [Ectocarpus sp. 8 AP-2014]
MSVLSFFSHESVMRLAISTTTESGNSGQHSCDPRIKRGPIIYAAVRHR